MSLCWKRNKNKPCNFYYKMVPLIAVIKLIKFDEQLKIQTRNWMELNEMSKSASCESNITSEYSNNPPSQKPFYANDNWSS